MSRRKAITAEEIASAFLELGVGANTSRAAALEAYRSHAFEEEMKRPGDDSQASPQQSSSRAAQRRRAPGDDEVDAEMGEYAAKRVPAANQANSNFHDPEADQKNYTSNG